MILIPWVLWMPALAAASPSPVQDVERVVEQLAGDDPEARERALEVLREAGPRIRPQLEKALRDARDPDVRDLLERLLLPLRIAGRVELVGGAPQGLVRLASVDGRFRQDVGRRRPGKIAHRFSWSPDGRRLAYVVGEGRYSSGDVHVLDLSTLEETRAAGDVCGPFRPVWSRDGRELAFVRMRQDKDLDFRVYSLEAGREASRRTRDRRDWAWSPDGADVVERWFGYVGSEGPHFSSGHGQGFLDLPWDPSFPELFRTFTPPVLSADGRRAFFFGELADGFTTGSSSVWTTLPLRMLDRETGKVVTLAEGVSGKQFEFFRNGLCVSPAGTHAAFVRDSERGGKVCVVDLETRREKILGEGRSPAWSPDGRRLAYERSGGGTRIVPVGEGAEEILEGLGSPSFAPRSR